MLNGSAFGDWQTTSCHKQSASGKMPFDLNLPKPAFAANPLALTAATLALVSDTPAFGAHRLLWRPAALALRLPGWLSPGMNPHHHCLPGKSRNWGVQPRFLPWLSGHPKPPCLRLRIKTPALAQNHAGEGHDSHFFHKNCARMGGRLQPVQRAARARPAALHHMGVNLRRLHTLVAQQVLDGADVRSRLQQMRGKAVPQRVAARLFRDPNSTSCPKSSFLF